ncbi:MAG: BatD family protein [Lentisphaeria bacterium]|jgi:hypothetical protein
MKNPIIRRVPALWLLLLAAGLLCAQQTPQLEVAVESTLVYRGEPFLLQVKVVSEKEAEQPVFPPSQDFRVEEVMAPSRNRSTSVQIVNGRMIREERNELLFNFSLVPLRTGELRIPAIPVRIDGKLYATRASQIRCQEPETIDDVGLEMLVSATECYVGEPLMLTWNWYVGRRVGDFRFNLPVLAMEEFWFPEYSPEIDQRYLKEYLRIAIGQGKTMIGRQGLGHWQNRQLTQVTFSQPLIPKQAGSYTLPASSVVFAIEDTRGGRQRRSLMDDFFSSRRMRRVSVASGSQQLVVRDLPTTGRPANYSGIVGSCSVQASAEPREVSVGDPIIVTLRLRGPVYLDGVRLPDLSAQESLNGDFKVSDVSPGTIENGEKVFQFTLRARHAELDAIPAIEVPYFDSKTGQYATATTQPIALTVKAVSTVTAMDVEGRAAPVMALGGAELRAWSEGIAANMAGLDILKNHRVGLQQWRRSPWWLLLCVVMPLVYGALWLFLHFWRRRHADPGLLAARQAAARCRRALKRVVPTDEGAGDAILAAWRDFFGAKLRLPAAALVFADIRPALQTAGLDDDELAGVERIFTACEAGRYAGRSMEPPAELLALARRLLPVLDKKLSGRRRGSKPAR